MPEKPIRVTIAQLSRRVNRACREQGRLSRICPESRDAMRAQARADALWGVRNALMGHLELLEDMGGTDDHI